MAFFTAINTFFAMFITGFNMVNNLLKAGEKVTMVADVNADAFYKTQVIINKTKHAELDAEFEALLANLDKAAKSPEPTTKPTESVDL